MHRLAQEDRTRAHVLGRLVAVVRQRRALQWLLVAIGIGMGGRLLATVASLLTGPRLYEKDFPAIYLPSRAVLAGVDPYLPLQTLADRFLGTLPALVFPHPTPHPPTVGLLLSPLGLFDYHTAAVIWLSFELLCLALDVYLLARAVGISPSPLVLAAVSVSLSAWLPVTAELIYGNLTLAILALLLGAYLALQRRRSWLAGALLGASMLLKPVFWPLFLMFIFRRDLRAVCGAAATGAIGMLASAALLGVGGLVRYITQVVPSVTSGYLGVSWNASLWTIGTRLFVGTGNVTFGDVSIRGLTIPPLVFAPSLAQVASIGVILAVLALTVRTVKDLHNRDEAFGVAVCISILASPTVWGYYSIFLLLPLAQVFALLFKRGLPPRVTNMGLLAVALISAPMSLWELLAFALSGQVAPANRIGAVPFGQGLLSLAPAASVLFLAWLLGRLARQPDIPTWAPSKVRGIVGERQEALR